MTSVESNGIFVGPTGTPEIEDAVRRGGGRVTPLEQARAAIWLSTDPATLRTVLIPSIEWVQLPVAGVERFVAADVLETGRQYTSAGPAYARNVAEHALGLMLACSRNLHRAFRATEWQPIGVSSLRGRTVMIIGCGRVGQSLITLLTPHDVTIIASTRSGAAVPGASLSLRAGDESSYLGRSDFVVLAAPATSDTRHIIGAHELDLMSEGAFLVNVARGSLIDTDALGDALRNRAIAGAALDVTDPEPLPLGHPLWSEESAMITPHIANTLALTALDFPPFIEDNVRRFLGRSPLLGVIHPELGY